MDDHKKYEFYIIKTLSPEEKETFDNMNDQ